MKPQHWVRTAVLLGVSGLAAAVPGPAAQRLDLARYEAINPGLGALPTGVVRSTPAAAWHSFLTLATEGRFEQAAHLLDVSEAPLPQQRRAGAETAEKLYRVLGLLKAREDTVSTDDPAGPYIEGRQTNVVVALRFDRRGITGEVRLRHVQGLSPSEVVWLFSRETVASVPFWYRVLVKGETARGAEPLDVGLGQILPEVERATPREAMAGFLTACQEGRFDLAAYYLDLGAIPLEHQRTEGARLSRRLMLILQRTGWVATDKLSNDPLGTPETGVPENEQLFAVLQVRHQPVELRLSHRSDAELGHVWTISQATVEQVDRLYEAHGYGWLGDHAPLALFSLSIADLQLWQWLGILAGLLAAWLVGRHLGRWVVFVLQRVARRTSLVWDDAVAWALEGPMGFFLWAGILALLARWLGLTPDAWSLAREICKLLALAGLGWFLSRLVDATAARVRETATEGSQVGLGFLPMAVRFAKVVVVVLLLLAALDVIGINVLSALVGIGLGGVALAFAAQKTLENLFGTASIASDRPFQVGDFVTIGQDTGTVEEVGFRSTRVRTLARTLVTIPNGLVASGRVENFSARDRILYNPTIGLAFGATAVQLTYVIDEIKRLLVSHPQVFQGEHRVRFRAIGESGLQVELFCWIATRDWNAYTGIVEEINFGIAAIVNSAGCQFAVPGRALYVPREGAVDTERLRAIVEEVERRHERGELGGSATVPARPDGSKR